MGKHRKWFWISGLYDNKGDILLNGMILSGTHCTRVIDSLQFTPVQLPLLPQLVWSISQGHEDQVLALLERKWITQQRGLPPRS